MVASILRNLNLQLTFDYLKKTFSLKSMENKFRKIGLRIKKKLKVETENFKKCNHFLYYQVSDIILVPGTQELL
jgi:hypothetical protein